MKYLFVMDWTAMTKPLSVGKMLEDVRASFGAEYFIDGISNKDCVVDLGGVPESRLILDLEKFALAKRFIENRCDYVLFIEGGDQKIFCVLIELKSGKFVASHVRRQLQGGANLIKRYCQLQMGCCALLIHKLGIKRVDQIRMTKDRVKFEGSVAIVRSLCGTKRNVFVPINRMLTLDC